MVTLRMVCIAVALLLGGPIAYALAVVPITVPGGEVVNFALDQAATVTDIDIIEPPRKLDRAVLHNAPEQLVEGHTVFLTITIPVTANVTNFTADIVGNVSCQTNSSIEGEFIGPGDIVPFPRRINELHEECHAAGRTFVTPDPFVNSSGQEIVSAMLQPNGNVVRYTAPSGQLVDVTEYYYDVITIDWLGAQTSHHLYAWSAPVLDPWTHTDGRTMNWYCPIPDDRLAEMGIHEFSARHESEMDDVYIAE